jgi:hypothetical protein
MKYSIAALLPFVLAGCATLLSGTEQQIKIITACKGIIMPTTCFASNDKGNWSFDTPSTIKVNKSALELTISCKGGLIGNYTYKATSNATLPMWGNIFAGGGVGALVDMQNSTGFEYPSIIVLEPGICRYV